MSTAIKSENTIEIIEQTIFREFKLFNFSMATCNMLANEILNNLENNGFELKKTEKGIVSENIYNKFIPEIWSTKLVSSLKKSSTMLQCVNFNYEGEIMNAGDSVNLPCGTDAPCGSKLVIDQRKLFAFKINSFVNAQMNPDIMEAHLENSKKAIDIAQDMFLLDKHIDVLAENIIGKEKPIVLTPINIYSRFVDLAKTLKKSSNWQFSPDAQKPWVIITPDIEAILLQCAQFTSGYQLADETLREGAIGRIAGMDVLVSKNLTTIDNKVVVLAGTNNAITFASKVAKMESIRDLQTFSDLVRGLYLYGAETVDQKSLAKMIVDASNF